MKAVIFAGGRGTRISEESNLVPKPLISIGEHPIIWHIMKIYSSFGINDFIICLGYKGYAIKEYFFNYLLHNSDFNIDLSDGKLSILNKQKECWNVSLIDTGLETLTANRLLKIKQYLTPGEDFCLTYGDGVGNIDIDALIQFHKKHNKLATMTVTQPSGRFGSATIKNDCVLNFKEKPQGDGGWINAGFFVLKHDVFDFLKLSENTPEMWEDRPLIELAKSSNLAAWRHSNFWMPMDTLRDRETLISLWNSTQPWRTWI